MANLIGYPGGKTGSGTVSRLLGVMPVHRRYAEIFLGHGGLITRKKPAADGWDIGIDLDVKCVNAVSCAAPGVIAMRGDALAWLEAAIAGGWLDLDWLLYIDPPFLNGLRAPDQYEFEFGTEEQHGTLLNLLKRVKCHVMISGYYSHLYARLLQGWKRIHYMASTRGGPRQEFLWMNYDPSAVELHEPARAGVGWREREKWAKKAKRWRARFAEMEPAERQLVAETLADVGLTAPAVAPKRDARNRITVYGNAAGPHAAGVVAVPIAARGVKRSPLAAGVETSRIKYHQPNANGVFVDCERITWEKLPKKCTVELRIAHCKDGFRGRESVEVGYSGHSSLPSRTDRPWPTRSACLAALADRVAERSREQAIADNDGPTARARWGQLEKIAREKQTQYADSIEPTSVTPPASSAAAIDAGGVAKVKNVRVNGMTRMQKLAQLRNASREKVWQFHREHCPKAQDWYRERKGTVELIEEALDRIYGPTDNPLSQTMASIPAVDFEDVPGQTVAWK